MPRCSHTYADSSQCKRIVSDSETHCYSHDPDRADERRRNATKGGRRGGRGRPQVEVATVKERLLTLADDVLAERVDKGVGAVASQVLNVYLRAVSVGLKAREVEEIEGRLEELEQILEQRSQYGT